MTAALQPSLFDSPVRASDPDTSHIASQRNRATDRQRALLLHARHPDGLTDFELAALMDRQQTSAGKRRHEWTVKGGADRDYIEDSGCRRRAPSGAPAIVWRIHVGRVGACRVTWLQRIIAVYAAVFTLYVVVRCTADWLRGRLADRRFRRKLRALQLEAEALLAEAALARMVAEDES